MDENAPYTVIVGVSQTSKSPTALQWAAAQAKQNQGRVIALRAWRPHSPRPVPSGPVSGLVDDESWLERETQEQLQNDVTEVLGADHGAEVRAVRGSTFEVLVEEATKGDLLVIDAPRQLITGPMFAHRLIYAATCPVVVMPPDVSGEPPSAWRRFGEAFANRLLFAAGTAGRPGYRPPLVR